MWMTLSSFGQKSPLQVKFDLKGIDSTPIFSPFLYHINNKIVSNLSLYCLWCANKDLLSLFSLSLFFLGLLLKSQIKPFTNKSSSNLFEVTADPSWCVHVYVYVCAFNFPIKDLGHIDFPCCRSNKPPISPPPADTFTSRDGSFCSISLRSVVHAHRLLLQLLQRGETCTAINPTEHTNKPRCNFSRKDTRDLDLKTKVWKQLCKSEFFKSIWCKLNSEKN